MIAQERTAVIARPSCAGPKASVFWALAFGLGITGAIFEALFPTGFSLLTPFSWGAFLSDAAKNLGIVLSFGVGLAYLSRLAMAAATETSSKPMPQALVGLVAAPASRTAVMRDAARIIGFSLLITLFARVSIHFGDNPVPITGQTLAVLLTGAALGSRLGLLTTVMYLAQGSAGMHVYAGGGFGHFWQLASGGYIIGFAAAAFLVGFLSERGWNRGTPLLVAMLIGNAIIYVPGLIQLGLFVGWGNALNFGLYPFIPGDLAKLYVASLMAPAAWSLLRAQGRPALWK